MSSNSASTETRIVQALHEIEAEFGAVVPPMHPATTFARGADGALIGPYLYSRYGSPTNALAERMVAAMEDTGTDRDGGGGSLLFASGLAAFAAVVDLLHTGERIVAPQVMYFGAQGWLRQAAEARGLNVAWFDQTDPQALARAVAAAPTRLVWIETPANPTWDVTDIAAAARVAHDAGALLGVDGTCAPPCTTQALALGADIVLHSATKYLNGHSDVTAGVVSTRDGDLLTRLEAIRRQSGAILGAMEAWLLIRGMRTLFLRFRQASASALAIARHFRGHARLEGVLYPGLEDHPGHGIAASQMTGGFGGMLSLLTAGGYEGAARFTSGCRLFVPATSLGGVESLIEHRKAIEGPASAVPDNLVRLSVGIERTEDLIADIEEALARI